MVSLTATSELCDTKLAKLNPGDITAGDTTCSAIGGALAMWVLGSHSGEYQCYKHLGYNAM